MSDRIRRRKFLGAAALTGLALGTRGQLARATSGPREDFAVAVMGTNGRGTALARGFARLEGVRVTHVCDVDERATAKAHRTVAEVQEAAPERLVDFRRALDVKSVDALVIAAPDHWHAPATLLACAAGKHVYVEKPASHNPREGELMIEAARKHGRVVQMGNQRRSSAHFIQAMDELHEGVIGRVYYARCGYRNTRGSIGRGTRTAVPSWLDFKLWQGPAPRRPFQDNIVHYNWHWFWHWGTGELGNNGVHYVDLCRWGLGVEYPVRVTSGGGRYHFDDDQETPDTHVVTFDFEGRKSILWEGLSCNRHPFGGISFHGTGGTLDLSDSGYTVFDLAGKEVKKVSGRLPDEPHLRNFVDCAREGSRPNSDIAGGVKSTLLSHLGNIAQRTRRTLHCDPKTGRILDDPQSAAWWQREYEAGWEPRVG